MPCCTVSAWPQWLVRRVTQIRVVRHVQAVLPEPAGPDVVGVGRDREDAAAQDQRDHHHREPGRRRRQLQQPHSNQGADRNDDSQMPSHGPGAPAGIGELVPDPVEVLSRQLESGREPQPAEHARISRQSAHQRSWQITAPAGTVWPTAMLSPETVPALWAVSGCSIFIASSTTIVSPASTCSPSAATILTIVPCIGLMSSSPVGAPPLTLPRRPPGLGRAAGAAAGAVPAEPKPAGTVTSRRFPPTSTVIRSRAAASAAPAGPA